MKKINFRKILLTAWVLSFSLLVFTACDNEDGDPNDGAVKLLSFGPSGVKHGESIKFIGNNLNKVSSIVLAPGIEIPSADFVSQSNDVIEIVVPHAAETGKVLLRSSDGEIESKTILGFDVPVVITSITPEAKPGTNITITGDKLNWVEGILFPAGIPVMKEDFVSQSITELVVTVPLQAQTGFLTFASGGTQPITFDSEEPLLVKLPAVATLTPSSIRHAAELTLTGTDLDLVTMIEFPGGVTMSPEEFISKSETEIVVTVPVTAITGPIILTAPSELTVETPQLTIILPNVTAFAPASTASHIPGATLTITGTDLDLIKSISFPGVSDPVTTFESKTATELKVVIPAGAHGGSVQVKTIHDFVVPVSVPFGDQLTLTVALYDDAVKNGFGQWGGWESTTDWSNSEQIRVGTKAIKADFPSGNWKGAAQLGGGNVSTAGTAIFAFSIYGGPGTGGKKIQVLLKKTGGEASKQVTITEGSWTDVQIPLSELGNPANVTEVFFQNADFNGVVYIDQIGLK